MLTLNVFVLVLLLVGSGLAAFLLGFLLRSSQIRSLKKKLFEAEREMLDSHASVLKLQKEKAALEKDLQELRIPVIPIKKSQEELEKGKSAKR